MPVETFDYDFMKFKKSDYKSRCVCVCVCVCGWGDVEGGGSKGFYKFFKKHFIGQDPNIS